jgi:hypothetical protein
MICPESDKICRDPECKENGCLEQRDDEEDAKNNKD